MAITSAIATSFKQEMLLGEHDLDTNVLKIALYTSSAVLSAATTVYSATNEISGTGYSVGGETLANVAISASGTTATVDFDNVSWTSASFTARGCLIYNSSVSNKAIATFDFGGDQTVSSGTFELQVPVADASNAIIRFA